MISFIVIGKNEGKTIGLTIRSIRNYVKHNDVNDYEIIYVDSRSTDNSIEIAREFSEVKIYEITGPLNAAIARNIGAKEAKGDTLIFLDADMEIQSEFHKEAFKDGKLIYPFVSGQLKNIFYNAKWEKVDENLLFPHLSNDIYCSTTGGYFIIEKKIWDSVNGMKTKFKRSQDLDLGLRLAKHGTLLLRKKDLFVVHHTVHYQNSSRMWEMLFNGSFLYSTSLLYREHLFNKYIYKYLFRNDYSLIILVSAILLLYFSCVPIILYLITIVARVAMQKKVVGNSSYIARISFLCLKDITAFFGFIFFFPKNKTIKYKKLIIK